MAESQRNSSSPSRDSDMSWRYIKARLRILQRPEVWGSMAIVLITMLVFLEYWRRSDELGTVAASDSETGVVSLDNLSSSTPRSSLPSSEDIALGADIDTLPLLLNDLGSSPVNLPPLDDTEAADNAEDAAANPGQTSLLAGGERSPQVSSAPAPNRLSSSSSASSTTATSPNPFGQIFSNAGLLPSSGAGSPEPTSMLGLSLLNGLGNSRFGDTSAQVPLPQSNPLNDALQRGSGVPVRSSQDSGTAGEPGVSTYSTTPYGGTQISPFTYTPSAVSGGQTTLLPPMQVSPPLGSTGYTLPPSLRGIPSSAPNTAPTITPYVNSFQAAPIRSFPTAPQIVPNAIPLQPGVPSGQSSLSPQGTTLQGPSFNSTAPQFNGADAFPQAQTEPPPFSVPNRVPGRYIGNGEINTFANP